MCFFCREFPETSYTGSVHTMWYSMPHGVGLTQGGAAALGNAAECLNEWALAVSLDPFNDEKTYNLLLAHENARERYREVTGKELPLQ